MESRQTSQKREKSVKATHQTPDIGMAAVRTPILLHKKDTEEQTM